MSKKTEEAGYGGRPDEKPQAGGPAEAEATAQSAVPPTFLAY